MNKRHILFALALMGTMLTGMAQEVTKVHLKTGSVSAYPNGVKDAVSMRFWSNQPDTTQYAAQSVHDNSYSIDWDVNGVIHVDKQYCALVFWTDNVPACFNVGHGLCFGTQPELSVESCDTVALYNPDNQTTIGNSGIRLATNQHYMLIGPKMLDRTFTMQTITQESCPLTLNKKDEEHNIVKCPMEYGKTYYYRTFAKGYVNGEPVYFYGKERSFRVPYVMHDADYFSTLRPTPDALNAFGQLLPQQTTTPSWESMETVWNIWRTTDEGSKIDLKAHITTKEFDDGTGYRLNRIPTQFYTWWTNREVEIDPLEGLAEIYEIENREGSQKVAQPIPVTDVDEKWGIPGNKYMYFEPLISSSQTSVTYRNNEVAPGTHYQLQIYFAPETVYEQKEGNENRFLPTKVRLTTIQQKNGKDIERTDHEVKEVSATEVTTLTVDDFCIDSPEMGIKIRTYVTSSELSNLQYNRILRIAGMRLIPVKGGEQ